MKLSPDKTFAILLRTRLESERLAQLRREYLKLLHQLHQAYLNLGSLKKLEVRTGIHCFKLYNLFKAAGLYVAPKKFKKRIVFDGVTYTPHGRKGSDYFCATTGNRAPLHHAVWIAANGPIPAGHNVYFKDGNRFNCDLSNLVCLKIGKAHTRESPFRPRPQNRKFSKPVPPGTIPALYEKYQNGASLISLASPLGRSDSWLRGMFIRHGYEIRQASCQRSGHRHAGAIAPRRRLTQAEVDAIADSLSEIRVPASLASEWHHWPLARRGAFIARVRDRLKPSDSRPDKPFSSNVTPFDYATPEAHAIAATTTSDHCRHVIHVCSQGVIWRDQLFYWNSAGGGYEQQDTRSRGRRALTRVIWENIHGTSVAPNHVIVCKDGNPNNLDPSNLEQRSREELLRENQAAALFRISREKTGLLLKRFQSADSGQPDCLRTITARSNHNAMPRRAGQQTTAAA